MQHSSDPREMVPEILTLQYLDNSKKIFEWNFRNMQELEEIRHYLMRDYGAKPESFSIIEGRSQSPVIFHHATRLGVLV